TKKTNEYDVSFILKILPGFEVAGWPLFSTPQSSSLRSVLFGRKKLVFIHVRCIYSLLRRYRVLSVLQRLFSLVFSSSLRFVFHSSLRLYFYDSSPGHTYV